MNLEREWLKSTALQSLTGKWGLAIGVSFVAMLLGGNSFGSAFTFSRDYNELSRGALLFLIVWFCIILIIGGVILLGHNLFYIKLIRGENVEFSILFSRFPYFFKALGLNLLVTLLTLLWSLLLIIPGIIAGYKYSMASYIMAENPDIGIMDAINESKQMMDGNKMTLFVLHLSFFGWVLLAALTCGIGILFLTPYMRATEAAFYNELSGYKNNNFKNINSSMYSI